MSNSAQFFAILGIFIVNILIYFVYDALENDTDLSANESADYMRDTYISCGHHIVEYFNISEKEVNDAVNECLNDLDSDPQAQKKKCNDIRHNFSRRTQCIAFVPAALTLLCIIATRAITLSSLEPETGLMYLDIALFTISCCILLLSLIYFYAEVPSLVRPIMLNILSRCEKPVKKRWAMEFSKKNGADAVVASHYADDKFKCVQKNSIYVNFGKLEIIIFLAIWIITFAILLH